MPWVRTKRYARLDCFFGITGLRLEVTSSKFHGRSKDEVYTASSLGLCPSSVDVVDGRFAVKVLLRECHGAFLGGRPALLSQRKSFE